MSLARRSDCAIRPSSASHCHQWQPLQAVSGRPKVIYTVYPSFARSLAVCVDLRKASSSCRRTPSPSTGINVVPRTVLHILYSGSGSIGGQGRAGQGPSSSSGSGRVLQGSGDADAAPFNWMPPLFCLVGVPRNHLGVQSHPVLLIDLPK